MRPGRIGDQAQDRQRRHALAAARFADHAQRLAAPSAHRRRRRRRAPCRPAVKKCVWRLSISQHRAAPASTAGSPTARGAGWRGFNARLPEIDRVSFGPYEDGQAIRAHRARSAKDQIGRKATWTSRKSKRSRVNRREFVKGRRAAAADRVRHAMAGAGAGRAQRVRRLEVPARGAGAQPEVGRRAEVRHHHRGRRISTSTSRARSTAWAARAACSTTWSGAIRATAARPSFPTWRIAGRSRKDGKTYTFHPAQGRAVPRRRRAHRRRTSRRPSTASPSRRRASRIPRSTLFTAVERDQRAATRTPSSSSCPSRGRPTSSWRRSPAAGTSSSARRRWRTTSTTCAASSTSPAPARSRASAGSRTKSG